MQGESEYGELYRYVDQLAHIGILYLVTNTDRAYEKK